MDTPPIIVDAFELSANGCRSTQCLIAKAPMHQPSRKYQQQACRHLLHMLLTSNPFRPNGTISDGEWSLHKAETGAPILTDGNHDSNYSVSMSHSRNWMMVSVSVNATVGVDIECGKPGMNSEQLAEFMGWDGFAHDRDDFLACWTLWEACVKQKQSSIFEPSNSAFEALIASRNTEGVSMANEWAAVRGVVADGPHFALVLKHREKQPLQLNRSFMATDTAVKGKSIASC